MTRYPASENAETRARPTVPVPPVMKTDRGSGIGCLLSSNLSGLEVRESFFYCRALKCSSRQAAEFRRIQTWPCGANFWRDRQLGEACREPLAVTSSAL